MERAWDIIKTKISHNPKFRSIRMTEEWENALLPKRKITKHISKEDELPTSEAFHSIQKYKEHYIKNHLFGFLTPSLQFYRS